MLQDSKIVLGLILGVLLGIVLGYFISKGVFLCSVRAQRKQAVQKSREVLLGLVNEQMAPLLPNFPYDFKDAMFLGKGVDYLIFDGLASGRIEKIIFMEVKTGGSRQNKNEKSIEEVIKQKKISYEVMRI